MLEDFTRSGLEKGNGMHLVFSLKTLWEPFDDIPIIHNRSVKTNYEP